MRLVAFSNNTNKVSNAITRFFTGSPVYHLGWLDVDRKVLYDFHFVRRSRPWPLPCKSSTFEFKDLPGVTLEYIKDKTLEARLKPTFKDRVLFTLRFAYHLLGLSTRGVGGHTAASEANSDLLACGYNTPWLLVKPPLNPAVVFTWAKSLPEPAIPVFFEI